MGNGSWMDEFGACRVCGGEIPHGHASNCDILKLEQRAAKLDTLLVAAKPVVERFWSDAEGEKEWATFQDEIIHLGEVINEIEGEKNEYMS